MIILLEKKYCQSRIIEQGKFAYSALEKAFEKQTKTIEKKDKNKFKF